MQAIELTNQHDMTLEALEAELDRLNEEALAIMQAPPEPGKPAIVQLAGITQQVASLMADKDKLQGQQQALNDYARHCAKASGMSEHAARLNDLYMQSKRLTNQIMQAMSSAKQAGSLNAGDWRRRLAGMGIPDDKILEVETRNSGNGKS